MSAFLMGLFTGTFSSITIKVAYQMTSVGEDGLTKPFEKPLSTTFLMFVAMAMGKSLLPSLPPSFPPLPPSLPSLPPCSPSLAPSTPPCLPHHRVRLIEPVFLHPYLPTSLTLFPLPLTPPSLPPSPPSPPSLPPALPAMAVYARLYPPAPSDEPKPVSWKLALLVFIPSIFDLIGTAFAKVERGEGREGGREGGVDGVGSERSSLGSREIWYSF